MTDSLTGLMWTKDANLSGGYNTWQQALDYVAGMNAGTYPNLGYSDWRLPNVNELESLINANEANNATWLTTQGFTNVQASIYWSSTSLASIPACACFVEMWYGGSYFDDKSYDHYVWPVRSGQDGSFENSVISLPKTGQTMCYDIDGGEISCTETGQDGEYQAGVTWPSPRFTDNGNETVTDNLTGLMWTKSANLPGSAKTWQQALNYVKGMNAGTYSSFGYTDWRLPNRKELYSLIDFSRNNPVLPAGHPFTNVQADFYWTSTTIADIPYIAWSIYMEGGFVDDILKSNNIYVWPVRGGSFGPTIINLSSFTATPKAGKVIIEWATASEIDNAGFNLYRSESKDGNYVKINASLISAEGSPTTGATYQFVDKDVKNRTAYYYKLEDIDLNGTSTMHGPVSAEPRRLGRD
jgi:hypothetical protein